MVQLFHKLSAEKLTKFNVQLNNAVRGLRAEITTIDGYLERHLRLKHILFVVISILSI